MKDPPSRQPGLSRMYEQTSRARIKSAGLKGAAGKPGKPGSGAPAIGGKAGEGEPPVEDTRPWLVKNWMIALPLAFVVSCPVLGKTTACPRL